MSRKISTAVLISGRGSNMVALANAAKAADYPADIKLVISNNPEALGLQKAADMGINIAALDHRGMTREAFDRKIHKDLKAHNIELVCCAGYMRILSPWFVKQWPNRILNIHPSLLPKYKGLNTHARAIKAGDQEHGCTVHYVNEELDDGRIILQAKTDVTPQDTVDILTQKVLELEHPLYVKALAKAARLIEISKNQ